MGMAARRKSNLGVRTPNLWFAKHGRATCVFTGPSLRQSNAVGAHVGLLQKHRASVVLEQAERTAIKRQIMNSGQQSIECPNPRAEMPLHALKQKCSHCPGSTFYRCARGCITLQVSTMWGIFKLPPQHYLNCALGAGHTSFDCAWVFSFHLVSNPNTQYCTARSTCVASSNNNRPPAGSRSEASLVKNMLCNESAECVLPNAPDIQGMIAQQ